jgi:hypothetical protein
MLERRLKMGDDGDDNTDGAHVVKIDEFFEPIKEVSVFGKQVFDQHDELHLGDNLIGVEVQTLEEFVVELLIVQSLLQSVEKIQFFVSSVGNDFARFFRRFAFFLALRLSLKKTRSYNNAITPKGKRKKERNLWFFLFSRSLLLSLLRLTWRLVDWLGKELRKLVEEVLMRRKELCYLIVDILDGVLLFVVRVENLQESLVDVRLQRKSHLNGREGEGGVSERRGINEKEKSKP